MVGQTVLGCPQVLGILTTDPIANRTPMASQAVAGFCGRSVSWIPGADGASIRIHVSSGAVVVALSAVGIGLLMRLHIGAGVRGVPSWELLV